MKKSIIGLTLLMCVTMSSCGVDTSSNKPSLNNSTVNNTTETDTIVSENSKSDAATSSNGSVTPVNNPATTGSSTALQTTESETNSPLSTKENDWFFQPKTDGTPSGEPGDVLNLINKYSGYYLGDTSSKIIYLTFDEGYENGYSGKILDILKEKNVKAAFFVTTPYIKSNKDLIKRMVDEGHLVCNHSTHHPSMAAEAIKGKTDFDKEFSVCEQTFEDVIGSKMPKFFRPPMGKYSELSLKNTQDLGYKTIFWSFAYGDWDVNKQPSQDYAKKYIISRTHPGGIFLLHAVSKTNTEILPWLIDEWKAMGYEFKSLNDLPAR